MELYTVKGRYSYSIITYRNISFSRALFFFSIPILKCESVSRFMIRIHRIVFIQDLFFCFLFELSVHKEYINQHPLRSGKQLSAKSAFRRWNDYNKEITKTSSWQPDDKRFDSYSQSFLVLLYRLFLKYTLRLYRDFLSGTTIIHKWCSDNFKFETIYLSCLCKRKTTAPIECKNVKAQLMGSI